MTTGVDPYLISRLGAPTSAGGLEVKFECPQPKCVERRRFKGNDPKLYVNFSKGVFYCMRCSWGGSIDFLYQALGAVYEKANLPIPHNLRESIGCTEDFSTNDELNGPQAKTVWIPFTSTDWSYTDSWEYLKGRLQTIPEEELISLIQRGIIRKGKGKYWDRIFFVDIYNGDLRYWTARTILDHCLPKYLNPYGIPRRAVLFNQQDIEDWRYEEVLICEGVISAIVAGPNAVATYGRCVTDIQIQILNSFDAERFVIVSEPDRDAKKNTLALAEALTRLNRSIYIVDCKHDPAEMGRQSFQKFAQENSVKFSWRTNVIRRLFYAA